MPGKTRHRHTSLTAAALATVLATFAAVASAAAYPDYGSAVRAAGAAWGEDDFEAALAAIDTALAHRPGHPRARYNRALILTRLGRDETALETLEDLVTTGLAFDVEGEAFAALSGDPRMAKVVEGFADNRRPRGEVVTAATMEDGGFVPEGIAFDGESFLLGSIRTGRLVRLTPDAEARALLEPSPEGAGDGPWSIYGILLDGDDLWLTTNADRHFAGHDGVHRAAVFRFDTTAGEIAARHPFPGAADAGTILGDLAIAAGSVYVSDAIGGGVYHLGEDGSYHPLVPEGILRSPQGMAASSDDRHLFVADYSRGLFRVRLDGGGVTRLSSPDGQSLFGIDGLVRDGDRLFAVQNGADPHRVIEIGLSGDGLDLTGVRVRAAALDAFDEPTLGTMAGDRFCFVADSHWNRFDADGGLPDAATLSGPTILCLAD